VNGNTGNDTLYGEDGNDLIDGGAGDDILDGGYGDDTYVFSGAFGNDQINDYYGNDLVQFADANKDSLVFEQVGNTLQIGSAGSSDKVSIGYWYSYNDYKIETVKASDGSTISNTQVEQLIQAMASWSSNSSMSWSQGLSSNPQDVQAIVSQYWTAPTV
jgi:Ca2+-binding RTX toxin-like protein